MVGGPVVLDVVRADLLAAVAAAHLGQPGRALLGLGGGQFPFVELGPQDLQGPFPVLQLGALLGAEHADAGGLVQEVHRCFHLVHVLATGATGAGRADVQVAWVDLHLHRIGLRHHRHGGRGGVHPALGFGGRHPLHPVHARFEFQLAEHPLALDCQDQFLVAAQFRLGGAHRFHPPALALGIALVHPCQVAGPDRRLIPAGTGADLQHHAALIAGITGKQSNGEALFQGADLLLQLGQLVVRQLLHGRVAPVLPQQLAGLLLLLPQLAQPLVVVHQGLQP